MPETRDPETTPQAAQQAVIAITRTSDQLIRRADRELAPHGITAQQFNVLRILRGARGELLPTLTVGERMIQQTPGITRLLDRLEKKGLVRRERSVQDRRVVYCAITDAGRAVLERVDPIVAAFDRDVAASLTDNELHALADMLARVRAALD